MFTVISKIIKLFPYEYRRKAVYLTFAMIVSSLFEVVGIASIMPFMAIMTDPFLIKKNELLSHAYEFFSFTSVNYFLFFVGLIVLFLLLLSNLMAAFTTWMIMKFSSNMGHTLSVRLLNMYLGKPYVYYLMKNTSDMAAAIFTEINQIVGGILLPILQIISRSFLTMVVLACLFMNDVVLASSVFFVTGTMYYIVYVLVKNRLSAIGSRRVDANRARYNIASEAFGGIKDIKVLNREFEYIKRFSAPSEEFAAFNAESQAISTLPKYLMESVAFGGVLVVSLYTLYSNKDIVSVLPTLTFYAFAGYRLMPAVQMIFNSITTIRFNVSAIDMFLNDMEEIKKVDQIVPIIQSGNKLLRLDNALELKNIGFKYPETQKWVLEDLSISILANTTVGFVGTTGSGKTTLIDLILGLLEAQKGEIRVDGKLVGNREKTDWLRNVGYVSQTIFLADDTIAQNIAFGVSKDLIDMEAVKNAARLANIHDFIQEELPEKYETLVGERGVRLSGGQRQRIGIARALYSDPQVLVFDEATSALDNITESAIMEAISNLSHKKTIIMIAHRLTTVKSCDQIFVLNNGKLMEQGTYEDLISRSKYFNNMLNLDEKHELVG